MATLTQLNLMRAFALECQTRTRYTLYARHAHEKKLLVLEKFFYRIAEQETAHAELLLNRLTPLNAETLVIQDGYPVGNETDPLAMLRAAQRLEADETDRVYPAYAQTARDEGDQQTAALFDRLGGIERAHMDGFASLSGLLEDGRLFRADGETAWVCLNCGYVHFGTSAPETCPVCGNPQGAYIRQASAAMLA